MGSLKIIRNIQTENTYLVIPQSKIIQFYNMKMVFSSSELLNNGTSIEKDDGA